VANNPVNWSDPSGHCSVGGQQIYAGHCRVGNNTPYDYGYETGCENCDVNAYNEYHAGSEEGPIGFVIGAAIAAVDTAQVWEWVPALGGTAVDFASAVGTGDTDRLARYWDAAVSTVADTYQTVVSGTARDRGRLAGELGLGGLASKLIKLRKLRSPATNAARGLYDDVLNVSDDALQGISASERRAVQSLQTQIESHQQKLADYLANPDAYDNLGFLQNAPTQQIRQQIIQGRVNHLSHEMATFADHIRKILGGA
jgi:hypothetical protein